MSTGGPQPPSAAWPIPLRRALELPEVPAWTPILPPPPARSVPAVDVPLPRKALPRRRLWKRLTR